MVHLALGVDVLPRAHHHGLGRRHVDERGLARVRVRHPYRQREPVRAPAEDDGQRARDVQQQRAGAVGEGCGRETSAVASANSRGPRGQRGRARTVHVGPGRERREAAQRARDVAVRAVDVVVFLPRRAREVSGRVRVVTTAPGGEEPQGQARTLVRMLYSQFSTCCWTGIVAEGPRRRADRVWLRAGSLFGGVEERRCDEACEEACYLSMVLELGGDDGLWGPVTQRYEHVPLLVYIHFLRAQPLYSVCTS